MDARTKFPYYALILLSGPLILAVLLAGAMLWDAPLKAGGLSDFARIPLLDDSIWYRDLGGRSVPEIQDLDLFYHNIGPSVSEAKKADIILLGPSFVLYAIDPNQLRRFGEKHGLKIYNMAFFGVRSGQFSREIIERWSLRPKLWLINVDDAFDHFFSRSRNMWWFGSSHSVPIPPLSYSRAKGWAAVAKRNIRWRLEDAYADIGRGQSQTDHSVYRRIDDGSVYLDHDPRYGATNNKMIEVVRDQNCHTNPEIVRIGKDYLASIGGDAVFMLVPNSTYCPKQAIELGQQLGKEVILPPNAEYSSVDNGGHLDRLGAVSFTRSLLADLEQLTAFKALAAE
jgi:hypothetical protein